MFLCSGGSGEQTQPPGQVGRRRAFPSMQRLLARRSTRDSDRRFAAIDGMANACDPTASEAGWSEHESVTAA
jgi:hypothetical protein